MSVLDNFEEWKQFLGQRLSGAESEGMASGAQTEMAYRIGDFLADEIEPQNREERLLKELWQIADENEQHMMAHLMIKLVQQDDAQH